MNAFLIAATTLIFGFIPCSVTCIRGRTIDRLVGLQMANILAILILMLLAEGYRRASFFDLALTLAVLSAPGTLLFVHYLERWR